jgi:predicted DNA-binding transcriptional regulator AlpA
MRKQITDDTRASRGFLRGAAVREMFGGIGKTTLHRWVKQELLVPPVCMGPHAKGFSVAETQQLISARMAGANDEEIRALVRQLVQARTQSRPASVAA